MKTKSTLKLVKGSALLLLLSALNPQLSTATLAWPSPSTGFTLQQNSNVANTNGWSAYIGTVSDNGTIKSVTNTPPTGNWFFRLKK